MRLFYVVYIVFDLLLAHFYEISSFSDKLHHSPESCRQFTHEMILIFIMNEKLIEKYYLEIKKKNN